MINPNPINVEPKCAACTFLGTTHCRPNCHFAPHFPPERRTDFILINRIFGRLNFLSILTRVPPELQRETVDSMVFEAHQRARDPVGGSHRIIRNLERVINLKNREITLLNQLLQLSRMEREQDQDDGASSSSSVMEENPNLEEVEENPNVGNVKENPNNGESSSSPSLSVIEEEGESQDQDVSSGIQASSLSKSTIVQEMDPIQRQEPRMNFDHTLCRCTPDDHAQTNEVQSEDETMQTIEQRALKSKYYNTEASSSSSVKKEKSYEDEDNMAMQNRNYVDDELLSLQALASLKIDNCGTSSSSGNVPTEPIQPSDSIEPETDPVVPQEPRMNINHAQVDEVEGEAEDETMKNLEQRAPKSKYYNTEGASSSSITQEISFEDEDNMAMRNPNSVDNEHMGIQALAAPTTDNDGASSSSVSLPIEPSEDDQSSELSNKRMTIAEWFCCGIFVNKLASMFRDFSNRKERK